jgi:hypothetical protein
VDFKFKNFGEIIPKLYLNLPGRKLVMILEE